MLRSRTATTPLEQKQLLNRSIDHFKEAIGIYPKFPHAHYDLGRAELLAGKRIEALESFKKSTILDTRYAKAPMNSAILLQENNQIQEAISYYLETIKRDSLYLEAYTNLSFLYFKEGELERSIKINRLASHNNPDSYEPLLNIGKTYYQMNISDSARHYFKRAQLLNSNDDQLNKMLETI